MTEAEPGGSTIRGMSGGEKRYPCTYSSSKNPVLAGAGVGTCGWAADGRAQVTISILCAGNDFDLFLRRVFALMRTGTVPLLGYGVVRVMVRAGMAPLRT